MHDERGIAIWDRVRTAGWLVLLVVVSAAPAHAAPELRAAAGAIGGPGNGDIGAGCTTYGALAPFSGFFGVAHGIVVPAGGIGPCGYVGQQIENAAPSGSVTASMQVGPVILRNPGFAGFYAGDASALAEFAGLQAAAGGVFSDGLPGSPLALSSASSGALFADVLTVTSPTVASGSPGFVGYRFRVDGALSAHGAPASFYVGEARADLVFRHENGPAFNAAHFQVRRGALGTAASGGVPIPGWVGSTGQISGSGTVRTLDFLLSFPIVFGQPWEFALGLGVTTDGESAASFLSGARLVGLDVTDAQGQTVATFALTAASGTSYLPEPSTAMPQLAGVAGLLALARRRG